MIYLITTYEYHLYVDIKQVLIFRFNRIMIIEKPFKRDNLLTSTT